MVSKSNEEATQWLWSSTANGSFSVSEDGGEPLGRGTLIRIHLKEEAAEYAGARRCCWLGVVAVGGDGGCPAAAAAARRSLGFAVSPFAWFSFF